MWFRDCTFWQPGRGESLNQTCSLGDNLCGVSVEDDSVTKDSPSPQYELADPNAAALVESLRAFGYTTSAAVADLVDNSISADARNVWITFHWAGAESWATIIDDGHGMDEQELKEAMRAGSQSPTEPRSADDLGRFGLGLKTASFSQCRELTVISRRVDGPLAQRRWDLDVVAASGEWRLLKEVEPQSLAILGRLEGMRSGTGVLWRQMDRVVGESGVEDRKARDRFLQTAEQVEHHLAVTFHRFLERTRSFAIHIGDSRVNGWDPFLERHPFTQALVEDIVRYKGRQIPVRPFVLPHHSKLTTEEFKRAAGERGWNAQQGFYVYRNQRLIVAGGWLGLGFQKEEHAKLARIRVDLPNSLDEEWQIDVRKASARPPGPVREDLRRVARKTRDLAVEVYRHRGKAIARSRASETAFVWNRYQKAGRIRYRINREHPVVAALLDSIEAPRARRAAALRLIEETVPVPLIAIDHAETPDQQAAPLEGASSSEVRELVIQMTGQLAATGISHEQLARVLLSMEPFDRFPEIVAEALDASPSDSS
jgi:hypothetical protein